MKIRFRLIYLSLLITLIINSCGKDAGPTPDSGPPPRGNDSLGIGWQKIPMPDSIYFDDVFFVNDMIGYIAGSYLAKSVDGGLTWTRLNVSGNQQGGYSNIYFTDALHGCAVGRGVIWTTIDGGQNWQEKGGLSAFDVQFISATEGYLCGVSGLYKTIDGGFNWTKVPSITNDLSLSALFFLNNNLGWVALTNQVRKTEDGSNSFGLAVNATISSNAIYAMQFIDNNHGWASSFNGSIVRTVNGGSSWEEIVKDESFSDIHFFDNNNGFLFSGSNIYLTNNGGTTLLKQAVIRKSSLTEIHFTNPNHGWAVGDMGGLYRYSK